MRNEAILIARAKRLRRVLLRRRRSVTRRLSGHTSPRLHGGRQDLTEHLSRKPKGHSDLLLLPQILHHINVISDSRPLGRIMKEVIMTNTKAGRDVPFCVYSFIAQAFVSILGRISPKKGFLKYAKQSHFYWCTGSYTNRYHQYF
jgi:hypothetical protein